MHISEVILQNKLLDIGNIPTVSCKRANYTLQNYSTTHLAYTLPLLAPDSFAARVCHRFHDLCFQSERTSFECQTVSVEQSERILMPLQQECIFMSEARTRGGAERSLNTHFFLSLQIGKDLSSPNVDPFSPLPLPFFHCSPTLPKSLTLLLRSLLSSIPQNLLSPPTHCPSAKDHLDEEQYDHQ